MADLLIKNGLIVDGSGSPGFFGAAVVTGGAVVVAPDELAVVSAGSSAEPPQAETTRANAIDKRVMFRRSWSGMA